MNVCEKNNSEKVDAGKNRCRVAMKDSTSNAGGEAAELYKDCLSTAGRRTSV